MLGIKPKQPSEVLDYDVDFSRWLPDTDTILGVVTELSVDGELVIDSVQIASPVVKVWVSGGVDRKTYKVTIKVATEEGRVKEEEFKVRVRDN